jgi:dihydrofolate reductase
VLSHSRPKILEQNPLARWWNVSPLVALTRAKKEFGDAIDIEGGISLILALLEKGMIDELDLSVTPVSGGENRIDIRELTKFFAEISQSEMIGQTKFYVCTLPIMNLK